MDTVFLYIVTGALFILSFVRDRKKTFRALVKGLRALEGPVATAVGGGNSHRRAACGF